MEQFSKIDLVRATKLTHQLMAENRDYLIELDSQIGDGDLGITMSKSFSAASVAAAATNETDIGKVFVQIGFAILKAAPSTMGTLMATAFIGAGKSVIGHKSIDTSTMTHCFFKMAESVRDRGKANEGDKTMLDVLFPVARAMETYNGSDFNELMNVALETAKVSLEKTKNLINQHGKAAVFREKSLGFLDPGAAATVLVIEGFAKACFVSK